MSLSSLQREPFQDTHQPSKHRPPARDQTSSRARPDSVQQRSQGTQETRKPEFSRVRVSKTHPAMRRPWHVLRARDAFPPARPIGPPAPARQAPQVTCLAGDLTRCMRPQRSPSQNRLRHAGEPWDTIRSTRLSPRKGRKMLSSRREYLSYDVHWEPDAFYHCHGKSATSHGNREPA